MMNVTTLILKLADSDVPRSTSYTVYISQLISFARASSHFAALQHSQLILNSETS